jgi:hypothetical protein
MCPIQSSLFVFSVAPIQIGEIRIEIQAPCASCGVFPISIPGLFVPKNRRKPWA